MKNYFILLLILAFNSISPHAQIITTSPAFPTESGEIIITFDAALGNGGLKGYTGEVYAHTGLITNNSKNDSDWKYAPTWGNNAAKYKMTSIGNNKWTLAITPDIRAYYGAPTTDVLKKMAFVFRSKDNSKEGKDTNDKDIFVTIYEEGLTIRFEKPQASTFNKGETIEIKASASVASDIKLYVDNQQIATQNNVSELSTNYKLNTTGSIVLKATATANGTTEETTMTVSVLDETTEEPRPAGTRPGINYPSDTQATLVLQAPGKKSVYVVGDFNDWKYSPEYQLKKDGEYFWITLSGLNKGEEYAFQYVVDQKIYIADPYTEKVLDPWNDSYITSSVYPNLKSYPTGKATGIVSVLHPGQNPYQWQTTDFVKPDKDQLIIYEMLIRDFTKEHTYQAAMQKLPYLKSLGVNAIELMPVNEFEGNSSWGYNPSFYFAPDKYYGTKNDLKAFVDACHANQMAVIVDLVLNHSFGQSPFYLLYRDADGRPSTDNPWYNQESNIANSSLQWGYDFNHESDYTKALVDSVAGFWIGEYKIDGFRYDFTKGFSNTPHTGWADAKDLARIKNLQRMSNEVWKRDPKAYVIFEHLTNGTDEESILAQSGIMLWRNANHAYCQSAMGWESESGFTGIYANGTSMPKGSLVGYMESHDEERTGFKAKTYGNTAIKGSLATRMSQAGANAAFFLTVPGPKMIWQFGELGYDVSIDYNGRTGEKPVYWEHYDVTERNGLYQSYRDLIALRNSYPNLFSTNATFAWKATDSYWNNGRFITSSYEDKAFVVIGNFTSNAGNFSTTFPKTGTWYEYKNEESTLDIAYTTQAVSVAVPANTYKLYTNFKPVVTGIDNSLIEDKPAMRYDASSDLLVIGEEAVKVEVFAINGMIAKQEMNCSVVNLAVLQPGVYIAKATFSDGETITCKLQR